jgi:hypothetical protein
MVVSLPGLSFDVSLEVRSLRGQGLLSIFLETTSRVQAALVETTDPFDTPSAPA